MITIVCIGLLGMSILLFMYIPVSGFDWSVVIGATVSILLAEVAKWYAEHEAR